MIRLASFVFGVSVESVRQHEGMLILSAIIAAVAVFHYVHLAIHLAKTPSSE